MVRIRRARPDEAPALFAIWEAAVAATHQFVSPGDLAEFAAIVRDQYLPAADIRVAVDADDRPIAFMGATGASLDALFVDPSVHGEGVGTALVEHHCARHGSVDVDVNEQNAGAVAFYLARGFRRVGRAERDSSGKPYPILHLRR
ncbi:acetyltransferase [Sphingosinicella terrae]|uniref:acetyltransferase n=1 Tax=Sphingosinicella terrae TaxID=2172047 RepID=UPI000E0D7BA3|nr:acetyltransferase [Sphingosinicella terrae]